MSNKMAKAEVQEDEIIMRDCLQRFYDGWKAVPKDLREEYTAAMTMIGIGIMHGSIGAEFTSGFLDHAKAALSDNTSVFVFKDN